MINVKGFENNLTTVGNFTPRQCTLLLRLAYDGLRVEPEDILRCLQHPYTLTEGIIVAIVLLLLSLLTAFGNMLIGIAILIVRRLRNPANLLLFNLAASDFLISVIVLPFAIVQQVRGYWPFNELLCDLYIVFDVLLCTASILSLCAIAVDRYFAITRPLTYASSRTIKRMLIMIIVCWLMAALISIPPFFGLQEKVSIPYHCGYTDDLTYQVYATFAAFYIPLIVMLVLYGRVYAIVRKVTVQDSLIAMRLHKGSIDTQRCATITEQIIRNDDTQSALITSTLQLPYSGMLDRSSSTLEFAQQKPSFPQIDSSNYRQLDGNPGTIPDGYSRANVRNHMTSCDGNSSSIWSSRSRSRCRQSRVPGSTMERRVRRKTVTPTSENMKAVVTLGVIMGSFTLCWLPFFLYQLMTPILKLFSISLAEYIPMKVTQFFLWLGYMNSLLNPIIYAKFNQDFRLPFVYILRCRCKGIDQQVRRQSFVTQFELNDFARPSFIDPRPPRRPTRMRNSSSSTLRPSTDA
ncbi:5-hydroxytryptamine receptor 7 [Clonorchis sinensis]|uniref:5-hydroxytryptamine receptor 7 n=1 Tax=Clonorchis sinensis TaxID=79923 RepID=G7YAY0_CLOSI|nr:5-hydroxytryptamine receptor 7 [Clonorchis sinensis]